ncbi:MAG: hypothetical protein ACJ8H8_31000 [Geminicoccaceae bacterium]
MASVLEHSHSPSRWSTDRPHTAEYAFEQAAARFVARPQLRCHLEQLTAAAIALHDEGLAELERRNGRRPGSFGGRMAAPALADGELEPGLRTAAVSPLHEIGRVVAVAGASGLITAAACTFLL